MPRVVVGNGPVPRGKSLSWQGSGRVGGIMAWSGLDENRAAGPAIVGTVSDIGVIPLRKSQALRVEQARFGGRVR
jgi:hypothetical protein